MTIDLQRLRRGEQLTALGALLLFVFLFFFSWYGVGGAIGAFAHAFGVKATVNGWHGHTVLRWLMLLTILGGLGLAFVTATQRTVALPVTVAVVTTAIAALTTVLLAYRVIVNEPGPNALIDVKIGAWLGLLSSALVAYGGYLSMRDEGTTIEDARAQVGAAIAGAGGAAEEPLYPSESTFPAGPVGEDPGPPPSPLGTPPAEEPPSPEPPPVGPVPPEEEREPGTVPRPVEPPAAS
jgi:hypothetical protein